MGQRVLWQMDHHRGAHGALNCPLLLELDGPLDADALAVALERLGQRHEALRTTFAGRGARLTQVIHAEPLPLAPAIVDLRADRAGGAGDGERRDARRDRVEARLQDVILAEVTTRTDPAQRPVRATLWRLAAERHVLCLTMHHLVTDGWSTAVLANDLGRLYAHALGQGPPLAPVGWQYAQWAAWHRQQLQGERLRRLQAYWRGRLRGACLPRLPRHDSPLSLSERRTAVHRAVIAGDVVEALRDMARGRRTALFTTMLAVYYALLARETGDDDLMVGSIFANRARREAQGTVGFLSNMVVLRARVPARAAFEELLAAADEAVIGAFANQELPFQMLPLDTIDARSMRPDAVVFQLFAGPMATAHRAGLRISPVIDVPAGIGSRWEFELSLAPCDEGLAVLLCHAADLYSEDWCRGFVASYVALAEELAGHRGDRPAVASGMSLP